MPAVQAAVTLDDMAVEGVADEVAGERARQEAGKQSSETAYGGADAGQKRGSKRGSGSPAFDGKGKSGRSACSGRCASAFGSGVSAGVFSSGRETPSSSRPVTT